MTMERWEEESDEDYAERLSEEIAIADNTETTKYFFKTGYEEDEIILNYVGEDSWTWKNHPEGPFKADQIIGWKNKAEKYDGIQECVPFVQHLAFEQVVLEYKTMQDKLAAINDLANSWLIMNREDYSARQLKELLQSSTQTAREPE